MHACRSTLEDPTIKRKSGARGLRGIVERIMLDTQFELPAIKEQRHYTVDEAVVKELKPLAQNFRRIAPPVEGEGHAAA